MINIKPEIDLRKELLRVKIPGRYVGGEFGIMEKPGASFSVALCFPDLYEIGMSNQAVKILYETINFETSVSCERVFCPAPDFEKILVEKNIPLYTLETGKYVKEHDILAFTVGYELSATNILKILDLSKIELENTERSKNAPIVIAGGPAITNPLPFGDFIDAVYIGEAEEYFNEEIEKYSRIKSAGGSREDLLEEIKKSKYFWAKNKNENVKKAVWNGFSLSKKEQKLIVPSIATVQDHGVVEIMRGCPNGCRFCHAGIFYRPFREKNIETVVEEVDSIIKNCGYREITLSSLSSGDYSHIAELIKILNKKYSGKKISFSFPSIRVNSFTLPLISEISKVRKSGLTFAVETPDIKHQRGLNKEAPVDRIIEILKEAKKMGWNKAKFYFMLGLPFFENEDETDEIINFLRKVGRETKMQLNINIGTFIPKPHTPFQWSFQLVEEKAYEKIIKIKRALPDKFFKVGYQSPFMSLIEGIISRGDEKAGKLILNAYKKGAGLDAWEEYFKRDVWRTAIEESGIDIENDICSNKYYETKLPWDDVNLNVGMAFLKEEYEKAFSGEMTSACSNDCEHLCGACGNGNSIFKNENDKEIEKILKEFEVKKGDDTEVRSVKQKILFSFIKKGKAAFLSHINVMNVFERAFIRAGVDLNYTTGFNPKPKLEFANPITLGFESEDEIASIEILEDEKICIDDLGNYFIEKLNKALPSGIKVTKAKLIKSILCEATGKKVPSLMSTYNGGIYKITCSNSFTAEKLYANLENKSGVNIERDSEKNNILNLKTWKTESGNILNLFKFLKDEYGEEYPFDNYAVTRKATVCTMSDDIRNDYFLCYD